MAVLLPDASGTEMARLHRAAGLLSGIGHADPAYVDDGVALLCMAAAEGLRRVGVQTRWVPIDPARVGAVLDEALANLAALPGRVFAATAVLDAAADARAARALLTRRG
jgi:hypothetical protein